MGYGVINGDIVSPPLPQHIHPYKGSRHAITRPDWQTKHDSDPRARSLLAYLLEPENHQDRVLRETPDTVLIKDAYPKAQVHLLLLPKWYPHRDIHPHDSFEDPEFLAMVRREAAPSLSIAVSLLGDIMHASLRKLGMNEDQAKHLLDQRRFEADFQIGIHAHPSQHELHVHIISRDMISDYKYSSRHYQAFNTPFFVPLNAYPLPLDDINREVQYQNSNLQKDDYQCWRCGKDFGMNYQSLQDHLREEWTIWIRESAQDSAVNGS